MAASRRRGSSRVFLPQRRHGARAGGAWNPRTRRRGAVKVPPLLWFSGYFPSLDGNVRMIGWQCTWRPLDDKCTGYWSKQATTRLQRWLKKYIKYSGSSISRSLMLITNTYYIYCYIVFLFTHIATHLSEEIKYIPKKFTFFISIFHWFACNRIE